jgi:hypothetical protein
MGSDDFRASVARADTRSPSRAVQEPRSMSPAIGTAPRPSVPGQYHTIFVAPAAAPSRTRALKRST